jgi:hypothetical protein
MSDEKAEKLVQAFEQDFKDLLIKADTVEKKSEILKKVANLFIDVLAIYEQDLASDLSSTGRIMYVLEFASI